MANARFIVTNRCIGATLKNGSGGGAPVANELAAYPMTNALTADRWRVWRTSAAPAGPQQFDLDFGTARSIDAAAIHGFRVTTGFLVTDVLVRYLSAGGYPAGTWTTVATISLAASPRDMGAVFGSVSGRYWRFEFTNTGQFSVGKLCLGAVLDTGGEGGRGAESTPFRNRIEQPFVSGGMAIHDLGDPGRDLSLPFPTINSTRRDTLLGLADVTGSLTFIDAGSVFYEVCIRGGRVPVSRNGYSLYAAGLEMARLP